MKIENIRNRIVRDYFTPSRGDEYREILQLAINKNYTVTSLFDFYRLCQTNSPEIDQKKFLCLRHDIDIINPKATKSFYDIEKSLGVKATYYFRYYTIKNNLGLLNELLENGFEVGYHFEEIASYAKQNQINNKEVLLSNIDTIRELFKENFNYFKNNYHKQIRSICSHGDWLNVRLNLQNTVLVTQELINDLDLAFEAYQPDFLSLFDVYVSDVAEYPKRWKGNSPQSSINNNIKKICLLTHERFWFTSPYYNTRANIKSLSEILIFKLRLKLS